MLDVKRINNNKDDIFNYKGYFVEHGRDEEKQFFEFGAHFSYKELYMSLMKLKLIKEKSEKIVKLKPKKKLNIEKINEKDKKIEENINNIIKEFKLKTRSRNIAQQEQKNFLNKNLNLNQLTYIPLNLDENKTQLDQKNNPNQVLINLNNKIKQLNNKYILTRNHEQKYSYELPFFFTDNSIKNNLVYNKGTHVTKNFENFENSNSIYKINNNMNLYKSYQNQIKKRNEIKEKKFNFIKSDLLCDKINMNNKNNNKRLFSSNMDYYLNKYQFKKYKFSPLKKFQTKNIPVSGGINASNKINSPLKNNEYNHNDNLNQKYIIKRIFNNRNINLNKINSFSADNKKEKIMNRNIISKSHYLENNISNISGNSQNKSKNITFQNMLQDLNHSRIHHIKNTKSNIIKERPLMNNINYNEQIRKSKIQNLFKLLNKHEKISRNKNMNYFLNNTSYINYTHQNQNDKSNLNLTNTKSIFLDLNNILLNKEKNKIRLSKNLLNNTKNITMNNNNKYINSSYYNKSIYNTTVQNIPNSNLNKINKPPQINKIQTTQNNPDINNLKGIKSLRKKSKNNNVNINININNNNKIIYNKVYEYKSPLLNNINSKIIKHPISLKGPNNINKTLNSKLIKNIRNNNNIKNNKNIKFINIQLPKKKILNRYNINTNTNNNNNINNNNDLFS